MTRIYLIRHGESIGNAKRMYLGHTNLGLSELGHRQAEITAEFLKNVDFSVIYSSDLQRALETAEPHAKIRGMELILRQDLREINVGEWEGAYVDELMKDERFTLGWRQNFGTFTLPGGENVQAVAERIYNAISEIAEANEGKTVAVVFHAGAMRAFYAKILGLEPSLWASKLDFPTNASYSVIEYEDGKFTPILYSQDAHLTEAKPVFSI